MYACIKGIGARNKSTWQRMNVEIGFGIPTGQEVRVAEMSRSLIKELGINFNYFHNDGGFGISTLGGLSSITLDDANLVSTTPDGFLAPTQFFVSPAVVLSFFGKYFIS